MQTANPVENLQNIESLPQYRLNPYQRTSRSRETNSGETLTVPDQSLTIKQILERHTRGLRTPDQLVGYYDAESDPLGLNGTNIETLDLSQKYDILRNVQAKTDHLRKTYKSQQQNAYEENLREQGRKQAENAQKNPASPESALITS